MASEGDRPPVRRDYGSRLGTVKGDRSDDEIAPHGMEAARIACPPVSLSSAQKTGFRPATHSAPASTHGAGKRMVKAMSHGVAPTPKAQVAASRSRSDDDFEEF